jgi:hypothetical protein
MNNFLSRDFIVCFSEMYTDRHYTHMVYFIIQITQMANDFETTHIKLYHISIRKQTSKKIFFAFFISTCIIS